MAQGTREGLHVYTILQGQGCEKMSHVVELHMLRAYCFQDFIVGPAEAVRIVHCPGFRRRKHIRVPRVLFVFLHQKVHRLLRNRQRPNGVLRFWWADYQLPLMRFACFVSEIVLASVSRSVQRSVSSSSLLRPVVSSR